MTVATLSSFAAEVLPHLGEADLRGLSQELVLRCMGLIFMRLLRGLLGLRV